MEVAAGVTLVSEGGCPEVTCAEGRCTVGADVERSASRVDAGWSTQETTVEDKGVVPITSNNFVIYS